MIFYKKLTDLSTTQWVAEEQLETAAKDVIALAFDTGGWKSTLKGFAHWKLLQIQDKDKLSYYFILEKDTFSTQDAVTLAALTLADGEYTYKITQRGMCQPFERVQAIERCLGKVSLAEALTAVEDDICSNLLELYVYMNCVISDLDME